MIAKETDRVEIPPEDPPKGYEWKDREIAMLKCEVCERVIDYLDHEEHMDEHRRDYKEAKKKAEVV